MIGAMPPNSEATTAEQVLAALAHDGQLWLAEVPNPGPRRQPLYDRHAGIRRTGVYVIRDLQGPTELFYVGKVVKEPDEPGTTNPNADGIIGRLSGHQNMEGSDVLARWWMYTHPGVELPGGVGAGAMRDQIRAAAAGRMRACYCACSAELASAVQAEVIRSGLPGRGMAAPVLNSPNWRRRAQR